LFVGSLFAEIVS